MAVPAALGIGSGGAAGNAAASVDCGVPAGTDVGTILLVCTLSGAGQEWDTVTDDAGNTYTEEAGALVSTADITCQLWWTRVASVPTIVTCDRGGGGGQPLALVAGYDGCIDTGTPYEDFDLIDGSGAADATPDCPAATASDNDRLYVGIIGVDDDTAWSSGFPGGSTTETGNFSSTTGSDARITFLERDFPTAGTQSQFTVGTLGVAEFFVSYSLMLIPAAGGAEEGAATLTGTGALSATGVARRKGAAALSGTGSLAAVGVARKYAAAALSGAGTLTAAYHVKRYGAAVLSGTGALTAAAHVRRYGAATLAGLGSLSADSLVKRYASAALSGIGSLAASGIRRAFGAATLTGQGTLTVTTSNVMFGAASLTGTSSFSAAGVCRKKGAATLAGTGAAAAAGVCRRKGAVTMTGAGTLTASGHRVAYGAASITATGNLAAAGSRRAYGAALLTGAGMLTVTTHVGAAPPVSRRTLATVGSSGTLAGTQPGQTTGRR